MTNKSMGPLDDFKDFYLMEICPYVNFPSCSIGSLLNILNIMVFSRKAISSPMNTIFLHLSIVELTALVINIPLTWHVCVEHKDLHQHVLLWEIFHWFGRCSTTLLYFISVWLTMMLAIWRYSAIAHPPHERQWCNAKTTRVVVIAGYVFGILLSVPLFLSMRIQEHENKNYTIEYDEEGIAYYIHFVLYGTALKLVPSVILTVFSYRLINTLFAIKRERELLVQNSFRVEKKISNIKQQTDFTTRMLLGVLVLFLLSGVPSGILGLLCIIKGRAFRNHYFSPTIHVSDGIMLISFSISFLVYYNLSQQFRITFKSMFKRKEYQIAKIRELRTGEI